MTAANHQLCWINGVFTRTLQRDRCNFRWDATSQNALLFWKKKITRPLSYIKYVWVFFFAFTWFDNIFRPFQKLLGQTSQHKMTAYYQCTRLSHSELLWDKNNTDPCLKVWSYPFKWMQISTWRFFFVRSVVNNCGWHSCCHRQICIFLSSIISVSVEPGELAVNWRGGWLGALAVYCGAAASHCERAW